MGIIITELGPSQSVLSNPFLMMLTVAAFPGHLVHLSGSRFGTGLQRQGLPARGALCTFRNEFYMQSGLQRGVAGTAICMHNFDSIRVADEKLAAKSWPRSRCLALRPPPTCTIDAWVWSRADRCWTFPLDLCKKCSAFALPGRYRMPAHALQAWTAWSPR